MLEPARFGQQPGIESEADRYPEAAVTAMGIKEEDISQERLTRNTLSTYI